MTRAAITGAELAEALGARRSGAGWLARCVAHEDREPSLSIGEGADGRPLFHCHAGCSQPDVLAALRSRGLWSDAGKRNEQTEKPAVEVQDLGPPTEKQIAALIRSRRITRAETLERVAARFLRCWGAEWLGIPKLSGSWKLLAIDASGRPRLDDEGKLRRKNSGPVSIVAPRELRHRNGAPIARLYDVEGESDLLAILDAGASAAVSATGGVGTLAGHEQARDWLLALEPHEVVVTRDLDDVGRKGASKAAEWWRRAGVRVRVLALPEALGDGGDVRDYLLGRPAKDGSAATAPLGTFADLEALADGSPILEPILDTEKLVAALAALDLLDYDRRREEAAKRLGVRVSTLDAEVTRRRAEAETASTESGLLATWELEPWPSPVETAAILEELASVYRRHLVLPEHGAVAVALWAAHDWAHDAATISPLLVATSPEKRCGKTTVLLALRYTARRPLTAANITPAALFRSVEKWHPTLLIDEADSFLEEKEELRGVLNSSHCRATASVSRVEGEDREVRLYSTWAPIALALIGRLADTLADRAIEIRMRRKLEGETVSRLRGDADAVYRDLRRRCSRWATDHVETLRGADPSLPDGLSDRAADNWRPLVAIADLAGGEWPERARAAALALSGVDVIEDGSARVMLLSDLRDLFGELGERLTSAAIVERLVTLEHRPWPEWSRGRPMTPRQLARLLAPFGIGPKTIRLPTGETPKGYQRGDFEEAFSRYLPSNPPHRHKPHGSRASADFASATPEPCGGSENEPKPAWDKACGAVADEKGGLAGEEVEVFEYD
jgi:putative DNA primase/helicase